MFSTKFGFTEVISDIIFAFWVRFGGKIIRLYYKIYSTVDLDISLPNDAVIHVPANGPNSHPFPASRSLSNILQEGYTWLGKVRSILWEQTLEAIERSHWQHTIPASQNLLLLSEQSHTCYLHSMSLPTVLQWFGMG